MMLSLITTILLPLVTALPWAERRSDWVENATVYTPPADWPMGHHSTSYARTVILNQNCETDNVLLSTFTLTPPTDRYYPIMKSTDLGASWTQISQVSFDDQGNYTSGFLAQPFLMELPIAVGDYPAGTVLFTGMGAPSDFSSTNIYIYASPDAGYTWDFVSQVAMGSGPNTTNGAHPIWEPFLMMYEDEVICYYSDQRDPLHGQKLAHQTSTDLMSWGPVVNDVTYANYTLRPGMTTVAKLGDGNYMLSYELGFAPENAITAPYAVHYRLSSDPRNFDSGPYYLLQSSTDGIIPSSGPYTVWTPVGGENGTIMVSDSDFSQVFINTAYGDPDQWVTLPTSHGVGYTRSLVVLPQESEVLLTNGGMYAQNYTQVTAGYIAVPGPWSREDTISSCDGKGFWNS